MMHSGIRGSRDAIQALLSSLFSGWGVPRFAAVFFFSAVWGEAIQCSAVVFREATSCALFEVVHLLDSGLPKWGQSETMIQVCSE